MRRPIIAVCPSPTSFERKAQFPCRPSKPPFLPTSNPKRKRGQGLHSRFDAAQFEKNLRSETSRRILGRKYEKVSVMGGLVFSS